MSQESVYSLGSQNWRRWCTHLLMKINGLSTIKEYSDNDSAKLAGLIAGDLYRTIDVLKVVH